MPNPTKRLDGTEQIDEVFERDWLADAAGMPTHGGKSPLDLLLADHVFVNPQQELEFSQELIQTLVERGLVPEMVKCLIEEFYLARTESQQWSRWLRRMAQEKKYIRPAVLMEWGEYRLDLVRLQMELAKFLFPEIRESAKAKKGKGNGPSPVRSYIPSSETRKPNPIADRLAKGQNPLVNGEDSVIELMARGITQEEKDHTTDFAKIDAPPT